MTKKSKPKAALHSSQFALEQMRNATEIGNDWNASGDSEASRATLNDVMSGLWALTSAVFFVGRQLALLREETSGRPEKQLMGE